MQKTNNPRNNYLNYLVNEINEVGQELNTISRQHAYSVSLISDMDKDQKEMDNCVQLISSANNAEKIYTNRIKELREQVDNLRFFEFRKRRALTQQIEEFEKLRDKETEKSQGFARTYQKFATNYDVNRRFLAENPKYNNASAFEMEFLKVAKKYNSLIITLNKTIGSHYPLAHMEGLGTQTFEKIILTPENQQPENE